MTDSQLSIFCEVQQGKSQDRYYNKLAEEAETEDVEQSDCGAGGHCIGCNESGVYCRNQCPHY